MDTTSTMSGRDAIARLVHRYADAVVRRDVEQWAGCWTDDARWALGAGREVVGRAAVVELWENAMRSFEAVVQNVYNGDVELEGSSGEGRWYVQEHFRTVGGDSGILLAHYDDTYRRESGDRWLFASRALTVHYHGPADLSGAFLNVSS